MPSAQRIEHVHVKVEELDSAVPFYTDVMGLVEQDRSDGTVYLGCGLDENFDLAVSEGGTGLDHVAVRVESEDEVESYEARLTDEGVDVRRTDGEEPGQGVGVQFETPTGKRVEFVTVEDWAYFHSDEAQDGRLGVTPPDLDHVTLMSPDVQADAEFLRDVVDFKISNVIVAEENDDEWGGAFTRHGVHHHDIAFLGGPPEYSMHHVAWEMESTEQMRMFVDRINQHGQELELGIGRHYVGDSIFSYFWEPGGNRFELAAGVADVDPNAEPGFYTFEEALSAWGPIIPPESFTSEGS
ncbi:VOC family protein [Natrarchaeobius oligotrophus]|uniref:Catechol 2,3-dioxygenase n=1 Tax=Natrarchaeobius chitinivorans TaxID=1679083 RepID=A0A3N6MH44_NATCH|nr:VOC family protein [Natrarchaeobius chitinivorans]RQH02398.1 catechol 2,3-dioxygenase [Natrarchaeobius chitinivorans]